LPELERPLNANSLYRNVVRKYGQETGLNIEANGLCVHSMRATAATNALSHEADIAKVQEWLAMLTSPPLVCTIDGRQAGGFFNI
jgi:integrase/recombinase XerD